MRPLEMTTTFEATGRRSPKNHWSDSAGSKSKLLTVRCKHCSGVAKNGEEKEACHEPSKRRKYPRPDSTSPNKHVQHCKQTS